MNRETITFLNIAWKENFKKEKMSTNYENKEIKVK